MKVNILLLRVSKHLTAHGKGYEFILLIFGLVLAVIGGCTGIKALDANTKSNLTACRSQLYQSENEVCTREFNNADGKLLSIYSQPDQSVTNAKEYCRLRLSVISTNSKVMEATNVEQLYDAFYGLESFKPAKADPDAAELRRMLTHMTTIVVEMHAALDYHLAGVLAKAELETWLGYARDIGPHPLFLTLLYNWRESHYMSRRFAETMRAKLTNDSPRNLEVIGYFYTNMLTSEFLAGLPDY